MDFYCEIADLILESTFANGTVYSHLHKFEYHDRYSHLSNRKHKDQQIKSELYGKQ